MSIWPDFFIGCFDMRLLPRVNSRSSISIRKPRFIRKHGKSWCRFFAKKQRFGVGPKNLPDSDQKIVGKSSLQRYFASPLKLDQDCVYSGGMPRLKGAVDWIDFDIFCMETSNFRFPWNLLVRFNKLVYFNG